MNLVYHLIIVKNLLKYKKEKRIPCPRNNSPSEENLVEA
jgi:hypothetical protein